MTTRTVTGNQRNSGQVGERMELGRYRTAAGVERVICGQRVATVVRFLPEEQVVLDPSLGPGEGGMCCPCEWVRQEPLPDAARQQRADDDHGEAATGAAGRGRTGVPWSWRGIRCRRAIGCCMASGLMVW